MGDSSLPAHVAIIMDGNGRWAKQRFLPRLMGHRAGIKTVKKIVRHAGQIGIRFLTLYTFSTENWKRPPEEISGLMKLLYDNLFSETDELNQNQVRLRTIGDTGQLPDSVQFALKKAIEKLNDNTGLTLILALNYGSRNEIGRAIARLARDVETQQLKVSDINELTLASYLDTADFPDPELIIRTSGEFRLSNFLMYQSAYSEYYITEKFWPDFDEQEFDRALSSFAIRNRRYGGI